MRLKEEIEGCCRATRGRPPATEAADGGVRAVDWRATCCRSRSKRRPRRFSVVDTIGAASAQRVGWRNGYEPKQVQSEAGMLELAVPQLRGTDETFRPGVVDRLHTRTADLENLVRGMYVRGLSTQDVSALYARHLRRAVG